MDKRAARTAYKAKKTPRGVYAIRCKATGEAWVGSSTHLDSQANSIWFELRSGLHRNRAIQAVWNAHGETVFSYEVLEILDDDVPPLLLKDLLEERRKHWERVFVS
jgi:hypothetical protein